MHSQEEQQQVLKQYWAMISQTTKKASYIFVSLCLLATDSAVWNCAPYDTALKTNFEMVYNLLLGRF